MAQHDNNTNNKPYRCAGYTLLELIIYTALVSMIVLQCLTAVFLLINSSQRDRERHDMLESEQFVTEKLNWLFTGVKGTAVWSAQSSTVLYFQNPSGAYQALSVASNQLQLSNASDTNSDGIPDTTSNPNKLTNNHSTVSSPLFEVLTINGQKAAHIHVTMQGVNQTDTFDKVIYLQ